MNKVARKGFVTAMVAGGVLACAGHAQADAAAEGGAAGSPGVLSGNSVQVPVDAPVNVCGNTLDVIGLLDPAFGNFCANTSAAAPARACAQHGAATTAGTARPPASAGFPASGRGGRHAGAPADESGTASTVVDGGPRLPSGAHAANSPAGRAADGARSTGGAHGSPGLLSGDVVQLPVDLPINIVGNSVNVVGVGNPSTGNTAVNGEAPQPPAPTTAPARGHNSPAPQAPLAARPEVPTLAHTGADGLGGMAAASAGLLLGGAVLHRRSRPGRAARTAAATAGAAAGAAAA